MNPFQPAIIPQAGPDDLGLISNYDLQNPLWAPQLYQPFGGQGIDILLLFKAMGAQVPVTQPLGEHWEEDRYMASFQSRGNVAAPGAGNNVVVTLATSDIDPTTLGSFPIIGDIVDHIPTDAKYQVIAKTTGANTALTLRPLKTTTNEAISANDYFFITTNSVSERSNQRDTQSSFQTKYEWYLQNLRNDYSMSGNALTESLKTVRYEQGGPIVGWASLATAQTEYKHLLATVGAMIWGEYADNTGLNMTYTTSGMIEQYKARAVNEDTGGTLTVADFEAMEEDLSSNWGVGNYLTLLSGKSYNEISSDVISDFNASLDNAVQNQLNNALFGTSGYDVNQLAATYSVKGMVVNGKNFGLKRLTLLDDPTQAAAGSMNNKQRDYGFVMPIGKTVDANGAPRGFVELKYKDYAGQNRLMRMWETGGASRMKNTPVDDTNLHVITEMGFDHFNLQKCGLFRNASLS